MPDYRQRVLDSQGKFRQLVATLPGFKGYIAKEARREADKMLRSHIGRELDKQRRRLQQVGTKLANAGSFDAVSEVESLRMKLQTVTDKIKTATYGYAGFFDAATVNEPELDALYEFDNSLLNHVQAIAEAVGGLKLAIKEGKPQDEAIAAVEAAIEDLGAVWASRQDVITGGRA